MKVGCLAVLITMGGAFAFYHKLISGTQFEEKWWIAGLLSFAAGMIVGNVHGLFLALKQKRASQRQRSEWNDGDLIVVSGRIQSLRSPMAAPFSGIPAVMVEYEIKSAAQGDSPGLAQYSGFMMAPCSVLSTQGSVNVVGFPLLAKVGSKFSSEKADYLRAVEFLKQTKFQEKVSNPLTLLKQINEVYSKNDGEIQAHFGSNQPPIDISQDSEVFASQMMDEGDDLKETLVPNGAEVTVSGTFRASRQAIEIGGGLTDLNHKLELGSAEKVTGSNIRQCLIWIMVVGGAFGAGNYFLLKQLGLLSQNGLLSKFAIGS